LFLLFVGTCFWALCFCWFRLISWIPLPGSIFGFTGLGVFLASGLHEALPYLIIGGVCLIPGVYHSVILYRAWRGHRGFTYSMIPSFQNWELCSLRLDWCQ
jgi:hypothetical protein